MSKKIKVILLEDLSNYGKAGEIIDVSEGYARNFLFPQAKAALATAQVEKQAEEKIAQEEQTEQEQLAKTRQQAEKLDGTELTLLSRVKDGNQIFGKITKQDISKALNTQAKLTTKAKDINLPDPITSLGSYDITVNLSADVETNIKVTVEPDPDSLPKTDDQE
jgi:large subunit ribosomal protein L9